MLSDPSILETLLSAQVAGNGDNKKIFLRHLLRNDDGIVSCWMCSECMKALERCTIPKLALENNLWIGNVPFELLNLMIPEQLLVA